MTRAFSSYPDWKAPAQDSAVLIWPEPRKFVEETLANKKMLGNESAPVAGSVPLRDVRKAMRRWLDLVKDLPLIVTAHQTELYHAGVWSKLALAAAVVGKIDADAAMIAVDIDAPKHLNLRWPRFSSPITDDPNLTTAAWSGLLAGPTPKHLQELTAALKNAAEQWSFKPMALDFLEEMTRRSIEQPGLSAQITQAMQKSDWDLGFGHRSLLASPIFGSLPYLAITHHLLARAGQFAEIYNRALADYRIAHRIRTKARPMPDLQILTGSIEVPFWQDDLRTGSRSRPHVIHDRQGWKIVAAGQTFRLDPNADGWQGAEHLQQFLQQCGVRLAPRALTLTLVIRLLVADQFIHGIGGGRYDQVTDQVIQNFFGIEPPKFAVTTATLYFPTAVGRSRPCLPCLAHEGHQLRHRVLGEKKEDWVRAIDQAPRKSPLRQKAFSTLHEMLAAAAPEHPGIQNWQSRVEEANRTSIEDSALFDREFFYAIQPEDRLQRVFTRYKDAFAHLG
jgi:hypothetical protein